MKRARILALIFLAACHEGQDTNNAILNQPPFAAWTDSIRQNPDNSTYYYERGKLLSERNDSVHAVTDLRRAISMSPQPDYVIVLSTFWLEHGEPDSAAALLNPEVRRFPFNQLLQRNLLMVYFNKGQFPEALRVNDTALGYDSASSGNWYNRAMVLDALKDSTAALHGLERAYALDSTRAEIAYELANRYADSHNPAALGLCDRIIRREALTQKKPDPYTIKGIYYAGVGRDADALRCFDQALATDYTFLEAYLEKGILLYKEGKFADALKVFTTATTVDDTFADGYYWMGRSQEALHQTTEARLNYERAIAFDKQFKEAREALARLGK